MGNCAGGSAEVRAAKKRNAQINKKTMADAAVEKKKVKLLLLGAGESGKSTLLKQMKLLYGVKDNMNEPKVHAIRLNVVTNMMKLCEATDSFVSIADKSLDEDREKLMALNAIPQEDWKFTKEIGASMARLWNDEGVRETWDKFQNKIQVPENLSYFLDEVERIFSKNYKPNMGDWLRVRVRSSGVYEEVLYLDGVEFHIWDVGGQRNERRKWFHIFDKVHVVIFVAAISEYDQVLYEDMNANRFVEAMELFDKIVNDPAFSKAGFILFLNKSDLYRAKINKSRIRVENAENPKDNRFTDFKGPYCPMGEPVGTDAFEAAHDAGIKYMRDKILSKSDGSKIIHAHITNATDTQNVDRVFTACKAIILQRALASIGLKI
uniref:Uncharacterized protein n=1 Tax=Aplanochytrium stocchinoi TaxID=215587 RepID=A0A7S3LMA2_9STRA|mmetsp:Transcript_21956/g.26750  ORF Transcript_21956/g.26750 Transcript_21956/m.26750 type:complete len:378 (+) Transcript_21956:482-1615(+)